MKETIMNTINKTFSIYHKELVDQWYGKWMNVIKSKLPANMSVSDAEIDSEITYQCQYLAYLFKGGHYPSFCNMYVVKRAVNAFWDEYNKLDHDALADAYEEFDDNYRNAYTKKHQYGNYDVSETATIDKEIERRDIIQEVRKMVYDNIDRKIIMLILEGLTYDEIAQTLNISKGTIAKRMRAVGQRYKEQQN